MKRRLILVAGLALCPFVASCAATSAGTGQGLGGIEGRVLLGPTCPVEQAGGPPCVTPIAADIRVLASSGAIVATGSAKADGRYRVELRPGTYTVVASGAGQPSRASKPVTVTVVGARFTLLDLRVDTGIR